MSTQDRIQDRPGPSAAQASPHDVIGVGIAFAAAGLYITLGAADLLPMPATNGPSAIVFCAGLAFLFVGATCFVRARSGLIIERNETAGGPSLSYRALAVGAAGGAATIATWLAISSGPRGFNLAMPIADMPTLGERIGRTLFALGAVIIWIYVIALTIGVVRKLFDRRA